MAMYSYVIADPNSSYNDASANPTANLQGWLLANGSTIRLIEQRVPASSTADAVPGEMCYGTINDVTYLFYANGANSWVRCPFASW